MLPLRMLYPSRCHLHSLPAVLLLLNPISLALMVDWRKRHHNRLYYDRGHGTMYYGMLSILATYTNVYMGSVLSLMKYVSTFDALIMI